MVRSSKSTKRTKTGPEPVVLEKDPSIQNVTALKAQLVVACEGNSTVVIDAGSVESIDTAALQLLAAFVNSVRGQSRTVEWRDPSSVFRDMADLADLSSCLKISDSRAVQDDDGLCPVF